MDILLTLKYGLSLKVYSDSGLISRDFQLYKHLSEKNIKFSILTYGDRRDFKYYTFLKKINIIPISPFIKSKFSKLKLIKTFFIPFKLKTFLKNIDIIKTDQLEGSWIGVIAKILYGKKLIIRGGYEWLRTYIDFFKISNKKKNFSYLFNYLKIYLFEYLAYKLADLIFLTNLSDIDFVIKKFKLNNKLDKIYRIQNFIDINLFKPLNLPKKEKHVLFIGILYPTKNVLNLLRSFKNLNDFKLDIIGKGPDERKLRKIAEKWNINVNFLGIIPNEQLPQIYNQYQIFILPSYYEGNPKVLLEAMSCGVACIGSNVRGISDIIKHADNGYLCNTDSESIKNAILELYNNESLRREIGIKAREFIVKNCDLNLIAKKEYSLYKSLVN